MNQPATPPDDPVEDLPIYWFARLERAVLDGDHEAAAEAQRRLVRLGIVGFSGLHQLNDLRGHSVLRHLKGFHGILPGCSIVASTMINKQVGSPSNGNQPELCRWLFALAGGRHIVNSISRNDYLVRQ